MNSKPNAPLRARRTTIRWRRLLLLVVVTVCMITQCNVRSVRADTLIAGNPTEVLTCEGLRPPQDTHYESYGASAVSVLQTVNEGKYTLRMGYLLPNEEQKCAWSETVEISDAPCAGDHRYSVGSMAVRRKEAGGGHVVELSCANKEGNVRVFQTLFTSNQSPDTKTGDVGVVPKRNYRGWGLLTPNPIGYVTSSDTTVALLEEHDGIIQTSKKMVKIPNIGTDGHVLSVWGKRGKDPIHNPIPLTILYTMTISPPSGEETEVLDAIISRPGIAAPPPPVRLTKDYNSLATVSVKGDKVTVLLQCPAQEGIKHPSSKCVAEREVWDLKARKRLRPRTPLIDDHAEAKDLGDVADLSCVWDESQEGALCERGNYLYYIPNQGGQMYRAARPYVEVDRPQRLLGAAASNDGREVMFTLYSPLPQSPEVKLMKWLLPKPLPKTLPGTKKGQPII